MAQRVAICGGGPLGLMALKNLKEDGFDVTLYETRAWVGGLWKYSDDSSLSTARNTIFNSSKYRSAISDFPVPDDMDDFPTAPQLHRYFESYCDYFNLWPHIKLSSRVRKVRREGEQWALEVESKGVNSRIDLFDKVVFACGPFVKPRKPEFQGIERFAGQAVHAINFHDPAQFKGKNVLVIGVHASSQDVVAGLSSYASKVYMSHRNGIVMLPRYTSDGSVYDRMPPLNFTILTLYLGVWAPSLLNWTMDRLIRMLAKSSFPNPPPSLGSLATTVAPSNAVAPPLIASELYPHFESGLCEGVPEVKRIINSRTVQLKSGRILDDVDAIVYCTGYHSTIPIDLEPQDVNPYPWEGSPPQLYRHIFSLSPDPAIRNSLAFLCQGAVPFPGFATHEIQALCVSQIWQGKSSLPPLSEMQLWHNGYLKWRESMAKKYNAGSTFYTQFLPMTDHWRWMDECAGLGMRHHFGWLSRWTTLRAWKLWWNDRKLYNWCLTGLTSPAMFRLFDMGKRKAWSQAREQIFLDNEKAEQQQKERQRMLEKQKMQ